MRKFGYHDSLSTASVAAGGTLGILIPPSIILIIYGFLTSQSIGKLFLAGILPGLLGIILYLGAVAFVVWRKPDAGTGRNPHVPCRGTLQHHSGHPDPRALYGHYRRDLWPGLHG